MPSPHVQRRNLGLVSIAAVLVSFVVMVAAPADASTFVGYDLAIVAGNGFVGAPVPGPATGSPLYARGIAIDSAGNKYLANLRNRVIEKITPTGTLSIFAGNGQTGTPTAGPATATAIYPEAVAVDSAGNVYIADADGQPSGVGYIEKVTPDGTLSIINSTVWEPTGVAVDSAGTIYVATAGYIDKLAPDGTATVFAGNGHGGVPVDGPATSSPLRAEAVAVDSAGNVYEADYNYYLTKITPSGVLTRIAGNGSQGAAGGGETTPTPGPATASSGAGGFVAVDSTGSVYTGASTFLLKIDPSGNLSILAGQNGGQQPTTTPQPSTNTWFVPLGLAADSSGNLFVASGNLLELTPQYADPPGQPAAPTVTTNNGQIEATPTPPASDGGAPITGYKWQRSSDGGATWTPTIPWVGLTNGTTYILEDAAVNAAGTGPWSPPSAPVTPEPPMSTHIPTNWTVNALAPTQVTLTATGGTGGYTWSLSHAPSGLTISPGGVLSANFQPSIACWNQPCTFPFTYTVTDSAGDTDTSTASVTVDPGPLYFRTPHTLPSTAVGAAYRQTIAVGRGWRYDAFTVIAGKLPPHISLVGNLGKQYAIITGRATSVGKYAFEVRATDTHGNTTQTVFYLTVS